MVEQGRRFLILIRDAGVATVPKPDPKWNEWPHGLPRRLRHGALPGAVSGSLCCPTASPACAGVRALGFSHSPSCGAAPRCCLLWRSPNDIRYQASSHRLICRLPIFFGEGPVQILSSCKLGCLFSYCGVLKILRLFWLPVLYYVCVLPVFPPSLWSVLFIS